MIDLHCHVLPGVDDGSPDLATSIEFLRLAGSTGTTDIIATSHQHAARYPNSGERLRQARETLLAERARLVAEGESLPEVHLGAEVHLDGDPVAELASGHRLSLAGGPSILLELPDVFSFPAVEDVVFRLRLAGKQVVLAHPERIGQLLRHPAQLRRLVEQGALGQLTASSIAGDFGTPCREVSEHWLAEGLLHVVGSDAHDLRRRPPRLDRARAAITKLVGEAEARVIFEERPRAILAGEHVDVPPPREPDAPKQGWLRRLFGG